MIEAEGQPVGLKLHQRVLRQGVPLGIGLVRYSIEFLRHRRAWQARHKVPRRRAIQGRVERTRAPLPRAARRDCAREDFKIPCR